MKLRGINISRKEGEIKKREICNAEGVGPQGP